MLKNRVDEEERNVEKVRECEKGDEKDRERERERERELVDKNGMTELGMTIIKAWKLI